MLLLVLACTRVAEGVDCVETVGTGDNVCRVPDQPDRDFLLHLPPAYDGSSSLPVLISFHGGGGQKEGANRSTCKEGVEGDASCMNSVADRRGWAVVYPDGTGAPLTPSMRTWNAGGGLSDGWKCVSGYACKNGVDDLVYVDALLVELRAIFPVDDDRIFATGISNGGAMSHRLACERADVFAGIAAVGGANQAMIDPGCHPSRPVPILQIHGTADPCWAFEGGTSACLQKDGDKYISVEETLVGSDSRPGWARMYGCGLTPTESSLPDAANDGTTTTRSDWPGCTAPVTLLAVEGGGHTWPGGWQYLPERKIGKVGQDWVATEQILDFFEAIP
jgi:polyhydroxybutyrate depolymerase